MKLAIVGKRNSGKSTLVNTLAGEQRVIVSEIAGTTRDAIDVRFTMDGRSFLAIDTAGLRRKKSFDQRIEWWALDRMEQAIDRCDVALVMVDATEPLSHVDHQVGMMLAERNKPAVIVVNKWDLAEGRPAKGQAGQSGKGVSPEVYEEYIRKELKGLWYAPIAFISAKNNENVKETIGLAFELAQQAGARMGTGVLNRVVRTIVERQGPPSRNGTFAKVYYAAQIGNYPPTIALVVNKPEMFTQQYERFLLNRLRNESPFGEVPIKLVIKGRSKRATRADAEEIQDLVQQAADTENQARTQAATSRGRRAAITRQADDAGEYFDEPSPMADAVAHQLEEALAPLTAPRAKPKAPRVPSKSRPKAAEAKARTKKRARGSRLN
jgi:GTP-binding protein